MPATVLNVLHRVHAPQAGEPVFAALAALVPGLTRSQARRALQAGLVSVGGRPVADPAATVPAAGAELTLDLRQGLRQAWVRARHGAPAAAAAETLSIIHLDDHICVVAKPAGLATVPPPGAQPRTAHVGEELRRLLRRQGRGAGYIGVVHRLDRDTSGCLAVALTREAARLMSAQFAGPAAERTYLCLVAGVPRPPAGEIRGRQGRGPDGRRALVEDDDPGVEAVTRYRMVRRLGHASELEVSLGTGRTHQIRVALAAIGCPVLGDRVYARDRREARAPRLMLHAAALALDHPRSGERMRFSCPMPASWREVADALAAPSGP